MSSSEDRNLLAKWLEDNLNEKERADLDALYDLGDLQVVLDTIATWQLPGFDKDQKYLEFKALLDAQYKRTPTSNH